MSTATSSTATRRSSDLADARPRWWHDVLAPLIVFYAVFTIESGVLVWVCIATAYIAGWRGVSLRGVIAATAMLAIYLVVRFEILDVGTRAIGLVGSGPFENPHKNAPLSTSSDT